MFGIGKKQWTGSTNLVGTVIGKDTYLRGSINSQEFLRVDGNFEGDITTTNDLVIGETGHVKGPIKSRNAVISGLVEGTVDVSEKLELLSTVKLYGDIRATILSVSEGALIQGLCYTQSSEPVSKPTVTADSQNTETPLALAPEKKFKDNLSQKRKDSIAQKIGS